MPARKPFRHFAAGSEKHWRLFRRIPPAARTDKAKLILRYANEARVAFEAQCNQSRKTRSRSGGALTNAEQDLLRAMLVFAGAGLDACLKQLIRDSLRELVITDSAVQAGLETFVQRRLRDEPLPGVEGVSSGARTFLARVLVARSPQHRITEDYIGDLTGESLQSVEQLMRAVRALGVPVEDMKLDADRLRKIFRARNEIIHEMDITLTAKNKAARKRRSRTTEDMTSHARYLLQVAEQVVTAVEAKLGRELLE